MPTFAYQSLEEQNIAQEELIENGTPKLIESEVQSNPTRDNILNRG